MIGDNTYDELEIYARYYQEITLWQGFIVFQGEEIWWGTSWETEMEALEEARAKVRTDLLAIYSPSFGLPTSINPDDSISEGIATTFSRSDHKHAIVASAAGNSAFGDSASEGVATSFSRSDHVHGRESVDNSTVEINTNTLRVKDGGITGVKLNSAVAAAGLSQDGSSNLQVNVDNTTIGINGSDQLYYKAIAYPDGLFWMGGY